MFSRSSQSSSSSQTPFNTILNTPALKLEFALLIFVSIDRMRKNLAALFELDPSKQSSSRIRSPPGFPASSSRIVEDDAPPPYTAAPAEHSENLIDFDEPPSADAHSVKPRRQRPRPSGSQSQRPLKPHEQWDRQQSRQRLAQALASHQMQGLRRAALTFFDAWRMSVLRRVGATLGVLGDNVRREKASRDARGVYANQDASRGRQSGYQGLPTPLADLEDEKKSLLVQSALFLLLGLENYPAHSRALLLYITTSLNLPATVLTEHEISTAKILLSSTANPSSDSQLQKPPPEKSSSSGLNWKIGLATVGGAALIGVTGGLAAPLIAAGLGVVAGPVMGAFGLGGLATLMGGLIGNSVLVGTLFGIYGGTRMGDLVEKLGRDVEDFELLLLKKSSAIEEVQPFKFGDEKQQSAAATEAIDVPAEQLRVSICISGSLNQLADITDPWTVLAASSTNYALQYEPAALLELGEKLSSLVNSTAFAAASYLVLRYTVFATLMAGFHLPLGILKAASVVDNPFNVALARSDKAGAVLAQMLIAKAQGERPVSLVGFGLGARVVWECCKELARQNAFGLVGDVVFMGLPGPAVGAEGWETSAEIDWRKVRSIASGRVINCFSKQDWVLRFLYRLRAGLGGIAGLEQVLVPGVENEDVSDLVDSHASYVTMTGSILQRIGFEIDDEQIRNQTEKREEAKRRDEINAKRRAGNVELESVLAGDGKVEMVDESNGKIVLLDLESGAVDEVTPSSEDDAALGVETLDLGSSEANKQSAEPGASARVVHTLSSEQSLHHPVSNYIITPLTEDNELEEAGDDSDNEGSLVFLAPEPEPEP